MTSLVTSIDFAFGLSIVLLPLGPVDTGNERTFDENARLSCLLPLGSFAGITEGRTGGLSHVGMSKQYRPQGHWNFVIEKAITDGLSWKDGELVNLPKQVSSPRLNLTRGYRLIGIKHDGEWHTFTLARVICWIVNGPPPASGYLVDHINRVRDDDRPENLRWVTPKENALNVSEEEKLQRTLNFKGHPRKGELCPTSRLKTSDILAIRASHESQRTIAAKYGIAQHTVSKIKRRLRWAHVE